MRTLVTGATGFAGSHLLDRLDGRATLVGWQRPGGRPHATAVDAAWQSVDLLDRDAVIEALEAAAPDRVYHLAGAPQVDTSWTSVVPHLEANVLGTHHLLDAIRLRRRPCRVVVVTSAQVYSSSADPIGEDAPMVPATPYGLSKLAEDDMALRAHVDDGLDVVVARPFNHAGPRQNPAFVIASFAHQVARIEAGLAEPRIQVGNLDACRDISDVRDVVEAYEHVMEAAPSGRAYNIACGTAHRVGDLLERLIRKARIPIRVSVDQARLRPNDVPWVVGDATRARDELAWAPHIGIDQTLADTLAWWRHELER